MADRRILRNRMTSMILLAAVLAWAGFIPTAWATDQDGDGVVDAADNCLTIANPGQCDADQNGYGNACDILEQLSEIPNPSRLTAQLLLRLGQTAENGDPQDLSCNGLIDLPDLIAFNAACPDCDRAAYASGPSGLACAGVASPCEDQDRDGVPDGSDNCRALPNSDQADFDLDGYGNLCDRDLNNNQVVDLPDLLTVLNQLGQPAPPATADINGNAVVDIPDLIEVSAHLGTQAGPSGLACAGSQPCADADQDGIRDSLDNCVGRPNRDQADSDQNGLGDVCQNITTSVTVTNNLLDRKAFNAALDSTGRLVGFYLDNSDPIRIVAFRENATGQFDLTPIYTDETDEMGNGGPALSSGIVGADGTSDNLIFKVNRDDKICFAKGQGAIARNSDNDRLYYGCEGEAGIEWALLDPEGLYFNPTIRQLVFDSQNQPYITSYQHTLFLGENHRTGVFSQDHQGTWGWEWVALPAAYTEPEIADPASYNNSCMAIDDNDHLYVLLQASRDFAETGRGNDPPEAPALSLSVKDLKDPQSAWTSSTVFNEGGLGQGKNLAGCQLLFDQEGTLHATWRTTRGFNGAVERANDSNWTSWFIQGSLFYGSKRPQDDWQIEEVELDESSRLGDCTDISDRCILLDLDATGRPTLTLSAGYETGAARPTGRSLFVRPAADTLSSSGWQQSFVRPPGPVEFESHELPRALGFLQDRDEGRYGCRFLTSRPRPSALGGGPFELQLTSTEDCQDPFERLPFPQ